MSKSNYPTHVLIVKSRGNTKRHTRAGVLFANDVTGGFTLVLSPGVCLHWDDDTYVDIVPNQIAADRYSAGADLEYADVAGFDEMNDYDDGKR